MSFEVGTVLSQLAAIQRTITGIGRCYEAPPNSVSSGDLPAFINIPGPAQISEPQDDGDGMEFIETRQYNCYLIVAPAQAGTAGEAFTRCNPWFSKVIEKLGGYQKLGAAGALQMSYTGDSGARPDIVFGDTVFYGIRFTVNIQGRHRVSYAAGE